MLCLGTKMRVGKKQPSPGRTRAYLLWPTGGFPDVSHAAVLSLSFLVMQLEINRGLEKTLCSLCCRVAVCSVQAQAEITLRENCAAQRIFTNRCDFQGSRFHPLTLTQEIRSEAGFTLKTHSKSYF